MWSDRAAQLSRRLTPSSWSVARGHAAPRGFPSLSKRSRVSARLGLVVAALLLVGPRLISTYTDWLWFGEVGFRDVFTKVLLTRVCSSSSLPRSWSAAWSGWLAARLPFAAGVRRRPAGPNDPIARYRTMVMSRLQAVRPRHPRRPRWAARGLIAQSNWVTVQLFLNGGVVRRPADPQFGLDVGFYAFDLPFYRFVLNWLFVAVSAGLLREPGHPLRLRRAAAERAGAGR